MGPFELETFANKTSFLYCFDHDYDYDYDLREGLRLGITTGESFVLGFNFNL